MKKNLFLLLSVILIFGLPMTVSARDQHRGNNQHQRGGYQHQRDHNHFRNHYRNPHSEHRQHYRGNNWNRNRGWDRGYSRNWGWGTGLLTGLVIGNLNTSYNRSNYYPTCLPPVTNFYDNQTIVYSSSPGYVTQQIPGPINPQTNCRRVTQRTWKDGVLISDKTEEICESEMIVPHY